MTDQKGDEPSEPMAPTGTVYRVALPPEALKYPGHGYQRSVSDGMVFERDVEVRMRDGIRIYIDLYRPAEGESPLPLLIAWSPYGKHGGVTLDMLPGSDVDPAHVTRHYHFEAAEPTYWCAHGYAVAFVDPRGTWYSEGEHSLFSSAEARDCFDLIEWAAVQAWSNGKIGMIGQSYFAIMQWKVAALKPPHLTCIAPWGGASDIISDVCNHGGIPETVFWSKFYYLAGYSISGYVEDLGAGVLAHPFRDAYWMDKTQRLEDVEVPAYIVADWSDLMIHTRGTLDAYRRIGSRHKWLEINGRKKWQRFVEPEHADRLRRFYDHFLKGVDSGLAKWPPIRLEVRERYKVGSMYDEREWPLARTRYTKLYLHNDGTAGFTPSAAAQLSYESKDGELQFAFRVDERLELTGYMKLKLWVSSESADDMDLFVAVRKVDGSGNTVHFPFDTIHNNGEAALGCIRVSHRHQDLALSTDYQPRLTHDRELRLQSGEIVAVNIEIYPSSTLFESGSTLQIIVKGSDIVQNSHEQFGVIGHTALRNHGKHTIHVGPSHDSHLLIPLIPPRDGMS